MAKITCNVEYVAGHLRYGHFAMQLEGEELEKFKAMDDKGQQDWLRESGEFVLDDYEINDLGPLCNINIQE